MQMKMLSPDDTMFVITPGAPMHIGESIVSANDTNQGTTIHQHCRLAVCLLRRSAGLCRSCATSLPGLISVVEEPH